MCRNRKKIGFISSIWDDGYILRFDENNQQCLWCAKTFQVINATKDISHVQGKKGVHIKGCYAYMYKSHITRYQELQHFKQYQKGDINDYSENIKASISSLHYKSSAAIESTIHHSSKIITSSNDTNISEMSTFGSASNITTESKSINVSNGSLIFGIDDNSKNQLLPTRPILLLPQLILLF